MYIVTVYKDLTGRMKNYKLHIKIICTTGFSFILLLLDNLCLLCICYEPDFYDLFFSYLYLS